VLEEHADRYGELNKILRVCSRIGNVERQHECATRGRLSLVSLIGHSTPSPKAAFDFPTQTATFRDAHITCCYFPVGIIPLPTRSISSKREGVKVDAIMH
jgi:hypothetical protein